uniref:serine hydrolase domain-containing protein n=1 Tax=Parerythrobacter lutipelagi TaxID=1964208 RepID=UPI001EFF7061|nr:serine hydrolase [Parerythrobacter lutipelagi]
MKYCPTVAMILAAGLLSACSTVPSDESATGKLSNVTMSMPKGEVVMDGAQILAWDDATRSSRFRKMEDFFPGLEVAPPSNPIKLERGNALNGNLVAELDAFMADTNAAGVMVLQDGKIRYEKYALGFGPEQRWTSFSVAKSFTSTLMGAALKDGYISSLQDPVSQYITGLKGSAYDDVSVEQLATMTSGVRWNEDYTDPTSDVALMFNTTPEPGQDQVVEYMKNLPREAPAGEKFVYKTGETNLIGVLVEEATGRRLADYAAEKIVGPAGFEGSLFWQTDLSNRNVGGCCLSLRLADYARFGQFVLEGGGNVVPAGWFEDAGDSKVQFGGGFGYGYQWWTYPVDNFGAQGIFGQAITIVPENNLVIAVVSNWPSATSRENRLKLLMASAAIAQGE